MSCVRERTTRSPMGMSAIPVCAFIRSRFIPRRINSPDVASTVVSCMIMNFFAMVRNFSNSRLSNADIPSVEKAKEFGVEWVYYPDPVGLHHVWTIFTFDVVR